MEIKAKDTLTAVELNLDESLNFVLADGTTRRITPRKSYARVLSTTLPELKKEVDGAMTLMEFSCELEINGKIHLIRREIPTQKSFCAPVIIDGVTVWLDAVDDIFDFILETHGECRPKKHVRLAIQDATLGICPEKIHPWCPVPKGTLNIKDCYRGEDCWLGPYNGISAHGGLDINHPPMTPIWAPVDIHDHHFFNSIAMGHNNNRWRGVHNWENGALWIFQTHHMSTLNVPEHLFIQKGTKYADGAGVFCEDIPHSHFVFRIKDRGEEILLDPWLIFRQIYIDNPELS